MIREVGEVAGRPINEAVLRDGDVAVAVLSIGAAMRSWRVPFEGEAREVLLSLPHPEDYAENPAYLGVIAGRVANRIASARFILDGTEIALHPNVGANQLHGGPVGISRLNWEMEARGPAALRLTTVAPDGMDGYPGAARFTCDMTLAGGAVTWEIAAEVDRPTPVAPAQHNYYNLGPPGEDTRGHALRVAADRYTPLGPGLVPTGEIARVDGGRFDFRAGRLLGEIDPAREGFDVNLALTGAPGPAAEATGPDGLRLRLWTDRPGVQLYDAGTLPEGPGGDPARPLGRFMGLCLEAQDFPNAVNQPGFGDVIARPGRPYRQTTRVEIAPAPAVKA